MKNIILKSTTILAFCVWVISACALDGIGFFGNIAMVAFIASSAWLVIFLAVNNELLADYAERKLKMKKAA